MYTRLFKNRTKENYRKILEQTIYETLQYKEKFISITMYKVIYDQLLDIEKNIVNDWVIFSEMEIFNRYNIGAIATKNFDLEHDEYAQRLSDIFGGSIDYNLMPNKF